jgi:hypothetical protein
MADPKHAFHCPACDEQGEFELPDEFVQFDCPTECGASFVKYRGQAGWAIRCVVRPVFRRSADVGSVRSGS